MFLCVCIFVYCAVAGGQWKECDIACIAFPAAILSQENHKEIFWPPLLQIPEYKLQCPEYNHIGPVNIVNLMTIDFEHSKAQMNEIMSRKISTFAILQITINLQKQPIT